MSGFSSGGGLAIGGTPARGLVFAGALSSGSITNPNFTGSPAGRSRGWTASHSTISVLVDWFPDEHRGWHVGGTAGLATLAASNDSTQDAWFGFGFGGSVLGGYDAWIGPEWSLGILGNLGATSKASLRDDSSNDTGYTLGAFWFTIDASLLYH
jgi:hypothetical protein